MNAPSNVADADHVFRLVRGPGLGRVSLTLCARCFGRVVWQWFQVLGPVRDAAAQAFHLRMPMIALCGECVVRVMGNGLKPFVHLQLRDPR